MIEALANRELYQRVYPTLWYYRSLVETFRQFGLTPLVVELSEVVGEIERLASVHGVEK